jgi:hypothetical protein
VLHRVGVAKFNYGMGIEYVLLLLVAGALVLRSSQTVLHRCYLALSSGVVMGVIWWLLVSNGWPRYLLISAVPGYFLIAMPFLVIRPGWPALAYVLLLVVLASPLYSRLDVPIRRVVPGPLLQPTPERRNLEAAVNILNQRAPEERVLTQGWPPQ